MRIRSFYYLYAMHFEFRLKRILPVVAGLFFLWALFLLSRFVLEAKENPNLRYIPANSTMTLRIDGKYLLQTTAYDLAYHAEGDDLLRQLQALAGENAESSRFRDAGIDFFSDVIIFTEKLNGKPVTGFIFNLADPEKFRIAMQGIASRDQAFGANAEVGILLLDTSHDIGLDELNAHAEKLCVPGTKRSPGKLKRPGEQVLSIETADLPGTILGKGALELAVRKNKIKASGTIARAGDPVFASARLKPDGFHCSMAVSDPRVQDTIRRILRAKGFDLPPVSWISLNYRGMNIDNGSSPLADLLLEFTEVLDFRKFFESLESRDDIGIRASGFNGNVFTLGHGSVNYIVKALGERTVFIGQEAGNVVEEKNELPFLLKGDLSKLTRIEGGGLFGVGINLVPEYKAGKDFFAAISEAEISVRPHKGRYVLDGKIHFREDKHAIPELLRLFLVLRSGAVMGRIVP